MLYEYSNYIVQSTFHMQATPLVHGCMVAFLFFRRVRLFLTPPVQKAAVFGT